MDRRQVKIDTSLDQVEGIARVAKARNMSKGALVREGIAIVTGVPDTTRRLVPPPLPRKRTSGWAAPEYLEARRKAAAEAKRKSSD